MTEIPKNPTVTAYLDAIFASEVVEQLPDWPYPKLPPDDDLPDATAVDMPDGAVHEDNAEAVSLHDELYLAWTLQSPDKAPWLWIIIHVEDNMLIGEIGTHNPLSPTDADDNIQIGYSLVPDYHGRGYMTEAAFAYVAWAFTHPELKWIFAMTETANSRSRRVLEKLGAKTFVDDDDDPDFDDGWLNWELLPEAFAIAQAARQPS